MQASEFQFLKKWPFEDRNHVHLKSRYHKFSWSVHADIIFSLIQRERNICVSDATYLPVQTVLYLT